MGYQEYNYNGDVALLKKSRTSLQIENVTTVVLSKVSWDNLCVCACMSLYVYVKQIWAFLLALITDTYWSTCISVIWSPKEKKKRAIISLLNLLAQLQEDHLDYETDNYI